MAVLSPGAEPFPVPRYSKAFEVEPSLHAGINAAVLLVAAGHQFDSSVRLQQIGASPPGGAGDGAVPSGVPDGWLSAPRREAELPAGPQGQPGGAAALLGRGLLPGGWHLGQRPGQSHPGLREALQAQRAQLVSGAPSPHPPGAGWLSILGEDWDIAVPRRYLVSVMETFLLYKHFQKSPPVPSARQELADFWLAFLLAACQPFVPSPRCPVRCASGDPPGGWLSPRDGWGGHGVTPASCLRSSSWSSARCCGRPSWRCAAPRRSTP